MSPRLLPFVWACLAVFALPAAAAPLISEFMADNATELSDVDGAFSDWIEIQNPDPAGINLQDYYLTDDPAAKTKWRFPNTPLNAGGALIVFASSKNRAVSGQQLHTNFQLSKTAGYVALVAPDGITVVSSYSYPNQKEDVSYGIGQQTITTPLLTTAIPSVLVPASAGALPADWNTASYAGQAGWISGSAPAAVGFDTTNPPPSLANIASSGSATQSTTNGSFTAGLAIDGNTGNFTHTVGSDANAFWQLTMASDVSIERVVLRNRTSCCGSRMRDITVEIRDAANAILYTSPLLNPENTGYTYPAGPASLTVDLVALTGSRITGRIIRVRRTADPDLSGTGSQGNTDEANVLSLGEVELWAVPPANTLTNLARTGSPAPTATQTSQLSTYGPALAIDGSLGNFTHTLNTDADPAWTLNLGRRTVIHNVDIRNRGDGCCQYRLRDITVQILAEDGVTVLYTSPLLNPNNVLNGPGSIVHDLVAATGNPVIGQYVRIKRTPDGSGAATDDARVLSLGEVLVMGTELNGYRAFIRTDIQAQMLNVNPSAFIQLLFTVANPAILRSLSLRTRYDDGFIAYLNGVKVLERNAPVSPAFNSTATADRDLAAGILAETIDLTAAIPNLAAGNNLLAIHGLNFSVSDPNFLLQPELTSVHVVVGPPAYLYFATPGTTNETAWYLDTVVDTAFSHKRGFYDAPFSLSITTPTAGAQIYYTTNNSEPSPTNGTLYTAPVLINKTTVLRARSFKADWKPTNIDTHTYLFLADVTTIPKGTIPQNGGLTGQAPSGWPTASVNGQAFNYGFDSGVLSTYNATQLREALTQLPSISVVTQQGNLTDPVTGIYVNAEGHGEAWERPASIEMLDINRPQTLPGDGHGEFNENCGLRIRGGASRGDYATKHSFRIFFSKDYGAAKLNYPLYGANGASEFDKFDLRGSQNYSWSNGASDANETLCRDPFSRESLGAMGQQHTRSRFAHVYLNGLYWGIFEIHERASASYGETYLGGSKDNYDVVKCGNRGVSNTFSTEATDGYLLTNPDGSTAAWRRLYDLVIAYRNSPTDANYQAIFGNNPDGTRNPALPVLLDVDNLIDYMLAIFYSGDGDATLSGFLGFDKPNNWFGMRDRAGQRGFTFFNHDAEHTLRAPNWSLYWTRANRPAAPSDTTGPFGGSLVADWTFWNPQRIHEALITNTEYRLRWADHVQKHLFNGGALTTAAAKSRWTSKIGSINKAIRVYAARYSNAAAGENSWLTKTNEITTKFFDGDPAAVYNSAADPILSVPRRDALFSLLTADGLFPAVAAPIFSQRGGTVPNNFQLTLTSPNGGAIYYTTDGSDPRTVITGAPSAGAAVYAAPLTLTASGTIRARVLSGGVWSAIDEAFFSVATVPASAANLVISEFCYHPKDPTLPAETAASTNADDFEFVELMNISTTPIDLTGVKFTDGISFTFGNAVLEAGQRVVLVKNLNAFQARYGTAVPVGGAYGLNLSNTGETIRLETAGDQLIRTLSYTTSAPWPGPTTDGLGFSMVLIAPETNPDHTVAANWRPSRTDTGSPGGADSSSYASWKSLHGISSDLGDEDFDGISNFMEYTLGSDPAVPSTLPLPTVERDANDYYVLIFTRPVGHDDARCTVQTSSDLTAWNADAVLVGETHNPADNTITATWRTADPISATDRLYMRVWAEARTP